MSVPIGPQRIEFNAHRVFSVGYLLKRLGDQYRLERFANVVEQTMRSIMANRGMQA